MALKSKYFDAIRIKPEKTKQTTTQPCDYQDCPKAGKHKVPLPGGLAGRQLCFCLEHVREYNKNFNVFDEMDEQERKNFFHTVNFNDKSLWQKHDTAKTTKASEHFANVRSGSAAYQRRVGNIFKIYGVNNPAKPQRRFTPAEINAFTVLDVDVGADAKTIITKYKALVKTHHPDANGGDRSQEDRFNAILSAYKTLKKSGFV